MARGEKERNYFRCTACHHGVTIDANVAPETTMRCPQCRKIFGRVDSVCAEAVDATNTLASQILKFTLNKLVESDESE